MKAKQNLGNTLCVFSCSSKD